MTLKKLKTLIKLTEKSHKFGVGQYKKLHDDDLRKLPPTRCTHLHNPPVCLHFSSGQMLLAPGVWGWGKKILQWKTRRRHNGDAADCKSKDDLNAARQHRWAADAGPGAITFIYLFFLSKQAQGRPDGFDGSPYRRLEKDWFFRMETSVFK